MNNYCPPSPKKILVVRHRFIGDTLLTLPFLAALREAYPEAQVDVMVSPNSGEVLEHSPYLNRLLYHSKQQPSSITSGRWETWGFWPALKVLKQERYSLAYVLKRSLSSAGLVALAGIPHRIGFATQGRSWLLTQPKPYPLTGHEADAFLSLLPLQDQPRHPVTPQLIFSPQELLATSQRFTPYHQAINIAVGIAASNPAKQWPLSHWVHLLSLLMDTLPKLSPSQSLYFHAVGSPADSTTIETLREMLPEALRGRLVNWSNFGWPLRDALALQGQCAWGVGVDSGLGHAMAATGKPVVTLFGPMSAERWHPLSKDSKVVQLGLPCQPCHLKIVCKHDLACLRTLMPQMVFEACLSVHNSIMPVKLT